MLPIFLGLWPAALVFFFCLRLSREVQSHANGDTNGHACAGPDSRQPSSARSHSISKLTWLGYLVLLVVTKFTMPAELRTSSPTWQHVWFYGWVTALSTGAGAAPLVLTHDLGKMMLAFGNAVAAGMMLSACYSLVSEGAMVVEPAGFTDGWWTGFAAVLAAPWARVLLGVLAGLVFILSTKKVRVCVILSYEQHGWMDVLNVAMDFPYLLYDASDRQQVFVARSFPPLVRRMG